MTIAQQYRIQGFKVNLAARGRNVVLDTKDASGNFESTKALIQDQATLADPGEVAKAQLQVFTLVSVLAGSFKDPRKVSRFTEDDGRYHKVLEYRETRGDAVKWEFFCEALRQ